MELRIFTAVVPFLLSVYCTWCFLTDVVGLNPALAGSIPMIGKIWDAITDPIMGNIVDRTQSKYGAKRFYLLIGSFVGAITFAMMWISISASANTLYFFYPFDVHAVFNRIYNCYGPLQRLITGYGI
jgi:Na+/melibiose symporter-like transporter